MYRIFIHHICNVYSTPILFICFIYLIGIDYNQFEKKKRNKKGSVVPHCPIYNSGKSGFIEIESLGRILLEGYLLFI